MRVHLESLTEEQRAVVLHREGPAVVIACPGSGKTRALTHRMAHLIQESGVSPRQILGITFTKAAAREMKERLARLVPPALAQRTGLYTFHGLAWRLVKDASGLPNLLEGQAQQGLIRQILKGLEINADQTAVEGVLTDIACFVGGEIPRSRFQPTSLDDDHFFRLWDEYTRLKSEQGWVDFDDMLLQARDLLRTDSARRQRYLQGISHLLVDEFQDTNALQWSFLQLLLPDSQNLMVVGDDDQAIYGWRGASPSFMLDFPRQFPGARQYYLAQNFRSGRRIFAAAAGLIRQNTVRYPKELQAVRADGEGPRFIRSESPAEEADEILAELKQHLADGRNPEELAVLYRTSMIAFPLINRLEKARLPFRVLGDRPHPFNRWMVKDVLSYIRWALGEASVVEVVRLLRRPSRRGIAKELLAELDGSPIPAAEILPWLEKNAPHQGARAASELRSQLDQLKNLPAPLAIRFIRQVIDYDRYIDQYCDWSGSDPREAEEVLAGIEQIPTQTDDIRIYLDLAAQERPPAESQEDGTPRITLSTFHGAKGLEWERVWILAAVEGAIPHRYTLESGSAAALEEERRLFYVGMTRAKDHLCISSPRLMFGASTTISRFVQEAGIWSPSPSPAPRRRSIGVASPALTPEQPLPPPLRAEDYLPGIRCWHTKLGEATIIQVEEQADRVTLLFSQGDVKKVFSLAICRSSQLLREAPTAG